MRFINQTDWMWTDKGDVSPDLYRLFRKDFVYSPGEGRVFLELSVCSTFDLLINGKTLSGQQVSDFPDAPTGACFDVTDMLISGENQILLQVHYIGEDFLTGLAGKPFVRLALYRNDELLLASGDSWACCVDTRYHSGLCCKVTPQLGFAFDPIPELSQDRRQALSKQAKADTEEAKIALRNIRRDGNEAAKKAEKNGELTEDELKKMLDDIQKLTDRYIATLEKMLAEKDKDLMTV